MKKKDLQIFEKSLLEEKRKILRHLEELSQESSGQEINLTAGDPADMASIEINQAALQKIGKRESFLLKKIEKALGKINDQTYGECESCGEEIGIPRLKARPVAELCIDCKTIQENQERRYSNGEKAEDDDNFAEDEDES